MKQPVDTRVEFISILNNKEKELGQERGILLLVGPARDLGILEQACFDPDQTWNKCITARYTLKAAAPAQVFGTLVQHLINDIRSMIPDTPQMSKGKISKQAIEQPIEGPYGRMREAGMGSSEKGSETGFLWQMFSPLVEKLDFVLAVENNQALDSNMIVKVVHDLLAESSQDSLLKVGQRLVVFLQLVDVVEDDEAWSRYLNQVAALLPYRTMLVISGLPESLQINTTVPTQRRLEFESVVEPEPSIQKAVIFKESAAISDEPSTDDKLKRRRYANALARMILHKQTYPPLSIGIHGPWGKGKSSFMEQIKEELEKERKESAPPVLTIKFNAWSYSDAKQVWAGLLNKVSEEIEKKLGDLRTIKLNLGELLKQRKAELFWASALPFFILLVAVGLGFVFGANLIGVLKISLGLTNEGVNEFEKAIIPMLGGLGSVLLMFKRLAQVMQPVSLRIAHFARLPNYSRELGFQHAVIKDLKFLNEALQKYQSDARVVVFIDDLDRCSEQRIMEVLQAIILVLAPARFFVILGIDTEMIYRAIHQYYTTDDKPPPSWFPRQYLKKILQLSFHLPSIEKTEREQLVTSLFSQASINELNKRTDEKPEGGEPSHSDISQLSLIVNRALLVEDDTQIEKQQVDIREELVEDTPYELAAFYDYQECLEDNPREIKRAINVHRLMKFMIQKHGVKIGGWTEQRQRQLVRWVLFCICWPELVVYALSEAEKKQADGDVLKLCVDKHGGKIKSTQRWQRLSHIEAKNGDNLLPADIDDAFIFVACSTLLVEDVKEGKENGV